MSGYHRDAVDRFVGKQPAMFSFSQPAK